MNYGAESNFITPKVVNELRLPWKEKDEPYDIENLEGQTFEYDNGAVKREIDHLMTFTNGKKLYDDFDILAIQGHDMILGQPWLYRHNPTINWRTGQVEFLSPLINDEIIFF